MPSKRSSTRYVGPKAPPYLSAESKRRWRAINTEYALEMAQLHVLEEALAARDRCQTARRRIRRDGMLVRDRFAQLKAHPLCSVERDARAAMQAGYKQLGIDLPEED